MSDSPYSNGPSRKSRFRQRSGVQPVFSVPGTPTPEDKSGGPQDAAAVPAGAAAPADRPSSVARPRQPSVYTPYGYASPPKHRLRLALVAIALLCGGGAAGYFVAAFNQPGAQSKRPSHPVDNIESVDKPPPLTENERALLDSAFQKGRARDYKDAEQILTSLQEKHPAFTKIPLEIARMYIYQQRYIEAQRLLGGLLQGNSDVRPDAFFLLGVLNLRTGDLHDAEASFAAATDADPTRSEFFYFWGDSLLQDGKPQEAAERFRSSLARNQYETAEDLLQLKVWLSDITADQDKAQGDDVAISASLASPYPRAAAFMAAAARLIKANRFADAANFMARGRTGLDPVVFAIVLHDPTFFQESWRPELAPFYKQAAASQPPAAAAAASPSASATPATPSSAPTPP